MWIRGQGKHTLINVNNLKIEEKRYCEKTDNHYTINYDCDKNIYSDFIIKANDICIGIYSTKEKALKVLDEIQFWITDSKGLVFQMPQDSEVTYD